VRTLAGADGDTFEVDIQTRGKWRFENCEPPPLTLELAAEPTSDQPAGGQSIVHLTTQCKPQPRYERFLVQEYLAYRIWELLGGVALRTRLAEIEYRDNETGKKMWTGHALLVEDIHLAAERLGRRWLEREKIRSVALDPEATALFTLFQYMIGNTDWSIVQGSPGERCCHNAALLGEPSSESGFQPLPFDFDASGLVNTGEIAPSEAIPITSVRQRLYRGLCAHNPHIPEAVEAVVAARPEIEALLASLELTPGVKRTTSRYLASFYETVNDPAKLQKQILGRCRS
jgi:hypothetical protein